MKLRNPQLIKFVAWLIAGVIRLWMATLRPRLAFLGGERQPTDPRKGRCIYVFWHEAMLFPTRIRMPARVLISKHADGELISQVCQHLGLDSVRGSTTRGGGQALLQMIRSGQNAHLIVTPDGPRGPRRQVQPGVIWLAQLTGLPIVPFGMAYARARRAGSWDRMLLPWPFTRAFGVFGPAFQVPAQAGRVQLEECRAQLEAQLALVTETAEQWARDGLAPDLAAPVRLSA